MKKIALALILSISMATMVHAEPLPENITTISGTICDIGIIKSMNNGETVTIEYNIIDENGDLWTQPYTYSYHSAKLGTMQVGDNVSMLFVNNEYYTLELEEEKI